MSYEWEKGKKISSEKKGRKCKNMKMQKCKNAKILKIEKKSKKMH